MLIRITHITIDGLLSHNEIKEKEKERERVCCLLWSLFFLLNFILIHSLFVCCCYLPCCCLWLLMLLCCMLLSVCCICCLLLLLALVVDVYVVRSRRCRSLCYRRIYHHFPFFCFNTKKKNSPSSSTKSIHQSQIIIVDIRATDSL